MHAFEVLADPTRRRILEVLGAGERSVAELIDAVSADLPATQPGVSQHLRVLRDHGFATARAQGQRRIYALREEGFAEADAWLARYRNLWSEHLDALGEEVARGQPPTAPREEHPTGPDHAPDPSRRTT